MGCTQTTPTRPNTNNPILTKNNDLPIPPVLGETNGQQQQQPTTNNNTAHRHVRSFAQTSRESETEIFILNESTHIAQQRQFVTRFYNELLSNAIGANLRNTFAMDAEFKDICGTMHHEHDSIVEWFVMWTEAFSPLNYKLTRVSVCSDGIVTVEGEISGKHVGELMLSFPLHAQPVKFTPTGNEVKHIRFVDVFLLSKDANKIQSLSCYGEVVMNMLSGLKLKYSPFPVDRTFAGVMDTISKELMDVDALAALGAVLRNELGESKFTDGNIAEACHEVARAFCGDVQQMDINSKAMLLGLIMSRMSQAQALIDNPATPAGWRVHQPHVLQAVGKLSTVVVKCILNDVIPQYSTLGERLKDEDCVFLDVGSGTSWVSIAMAREFTQLTAVGIDILDSALELAVANIRDSKLEDRVIALKADAADELQFKDWEDRVSVAWLPSFFLNAGKLTSSILINMRTCLEPGGWLLIGFLIDRSGSPLASAVNALCVARYGGKVWTSEEMIHQCLDCGFVEVSSVIASTQLTFVVARKAPNVSPSSSSSPPSLLKMKSFTSISDLWNISSRTL